MSQEPSQTRQRRVAERELAWTYEQMGLNTLTNYPVSEADKATALIHLQIAVALRELAK